MPGTWVASLSHRSQRDLLILLEEWVFQSPKSRVPKVKLVGEGWHQALHSTVSPSSPYPLTG